MSGNFGDMWRSSVSVGQTVAARANLRTHSVVHSRCCAKLPLASTAGFRGETQLRVGIASPHTAPELSKLQKARADNTFLDWFVSRPR